MITAILVIGILVGVAAPRVLRGVDAAAVEATAGQINTIMLAAELCYSETGAWPSNQGGTVLPPEMAPFLRPNLFAVPCPIGGTYDWDYNNAGYVASLKIYGVDSDLTEWEAVDRAIDDGNTATGRLFYTAGSPLGRMRYVLEY